MLTRKISSFLYRTAAAGAFGLVIPIHVLPAQTADPRKIVVHNFPQSLLEQAEQIGAPPPVVQNNCFVVWDRFPNGEPRTIVAGYSNGFGGAIRVLRGQTGGGYSVISENSRLILTGTGCSAELKDVDGDGINEVRISFGSMRGNSADWIFKWDGRQLIHIGPTKINKRGQIDTELFNSAFFDFDHDGTLQILSVGEPTPITDGSLPTEPDTIYHLQNGTYVKERDILFSRSFQRGKEAPTQQNLVRFLHEAEFSRLQNSQGPFLLRVVNGNKDGSKRSSGHIVLNSVEIVSPKSLNQGLEFLSVPVSLKTQNMIQVTLEGEPESTILVTVEDRGANHD